MSEDAVTEPRQVMLDTENGSGGCRMTRDVAGRSGLQLHRCGVGAVTLTRQPSRDSLPGCALFQLARIAGDGI